MNVLILIVWMKLAVLVGSEEIDFNTILQLIKARRSNSNSEADSIETIPVVPGFYWQKPEELSTSLFKNPAPWPDFKYKNATRDDTNDQTKLEKDLSTPSKKDHLKEKILKAVKNLERYRESQKSLKNKKKEQTVSLENDIPATAKFVSQIIKEIKANNGDLNENNKYKEKQNDESYKLVDLDKLVKKYLNKNNNRNYYQGKQKNYRYDKSEENSAYNRADKDVLEKILMAIENNDQRLGDDEQDQQTFFSDSQPIKFRSRLLAKNVADFLYGHPSSSSFHNAKVGSKGQDNQDDDNDDYESSDPDYKFNARRNDDDSDDDKSDESDMEKNPGNPFTVHKNKYKQNWPYDHFMDGDHMNINPFGPQFQSLGPSGPELFFGRKWWYFNQDDYKPMG